MDRREFLIFGSILPILAVRDSWSGDHPDGAPVATGRPGANSPPMPRRARFTGGADGRFRLDGAPFIMAAGELHPQRIPREYWDHRIKMVKAMGFNTISIYDFWSAHVLDYDKADNTPAYDFADDRNDLGAFIDLCKANNLWVFLRPGPFVDAYWDLGGIPGRLLATDGIRLRSSTDKTYMDAVESYIATVAPIVSSRLSGNGGPILMVQVENEYTSYGFDKGYLPAIRALWEKYGVGGAANNENVLFSTNNGITSDGGVFHPSAALLDIPIGGDSLDIGPGPDFAGTFERTFARYRQPTFSAETYSGWDALGSSPSIYPENENVDSIGGWVDGFLHKGVSFAVYVAHGGTSFAYGAAGNYDPSKGLFDPNVTSYDYRAPINEQGGKAYNRADEHGELSLSSFDDIRTAFANAMTGGPRPDGARYTIPYSLHGPLDGAMVPTRRSTKPPEAPPPLPMISVPRHRMSLKPFATIWDNLPPAIRSTDGPKACESLGMYSGCGAAYSTSTPALSGHQHLTLTSLADVATVFLDGALVAIIDRRIKKGPTIGTVSLGDAAGGPRSVIDLDFGAAPRAARIDIFVYTFGHAHKEFTGVSGDAFRKGIWGDAFLTSPGASAERTTLSDWRIHPLPMNSANYLETLKRLRPGQAPRAGIFYSSTFQIDRLGDCYVDISAWNLGIVWVNGYNLGRHFASASPQTVLFCPSTYLKDGKNTLTIFDNYITDLQNTHVELLDVPSTYSSKAVALGRRADSRAA